MTFRHRIAAASIALVATLAFAPTASAALDHPAPPSSLDNDEWVSLVPAAFEERATAVLTRRFGDAFSGASMRWVKCPKLLAYRDSRNDEDYYQPCEAEFGDGRRRRLAYVQFLVDGTGDASYSIDSRGPFRIDQRRCPTTSSDWAPTGYRVTSLRSGRQLPGCTLPIKLLSNSVDRLRRGSKRFTVWTGGAGTGGYPDAYRYSCTRTGKATLTVRCENRLGHRFRSTLKRR